MNESAEKGDAKAQYEFGLYGGLGGNRFEISGSADLIVRLLPCNRVGERSVNRVPGALRMQVPDDGIPCQRNVPKQVQQFVAHKLIWESELVVDDARGIQNNRVFKRSAADQSEALEILNVRWNLSMRHGPVSKKIINPAIV